MAEWLVVRIAGMILGPGLMLGGGLLLGDQFKARRSPADGDLTLQAVVQLHNTGDLRLKDIRGMDGLQVNVTGAGRAVFSSEGIGEVEGTFHHHGEQQNGLHTGNLSFIMPGQQTEVKGDYITVLPSEDDNDEVSNEQQTFDGLVKDLQWKAGQNGDIVGAWMQMTRHNTSETKESAQ